MQKDVLILGAGISGLCTAYFLKKKGFSVGIIEAKDKPGGVIQSIQQNGYICECGPNTVILGKPELRLLLKELGLEEKLIFPSAAAKNRYILRKKKLVRIPSGPGDFITTASLSVFGKIRALFEPFVKPLPAGQDQTVADFARRRFGYEIYKNFINPFVAGIYSGDAANLSTRFGFKLMYELEQKYNSVLKGFMARASERKKANEKLSIFSLTGGMQTLIEALHAELKEDILLSATVTQVQFTDGNYRVTYEQYKHTNTFTSSKIVSCLPAHCLPDILSFADNTFKEACLHVPYVPVAVLHIAYAKTEIGNRATGFGVLAPGHEQTPLLGILFNSRIFPHVAPERMELFTIIAGGARNPNIALLPEEKLIPLLQTEFENIMQCSGKPAYTHLTKWENAIPQYTMQYHQYASAIEKLEKAFPGFVVAGSSVHGISVPDCVEYAYQTSNNIAG